MIHRIDDVFVLQVLNDALKTCFSTQFSQKFEFAKENIFEDDATLYRCGVEVKSNVIDGYLELTLDDKSIISLMNQLLGTEDTEVTEDTEDAPQEILNMIFGEFKRQLTDVGAEIEMAIPKQLEEKTDASQYGFSTPLYYHNEDSKVEIVLNGTMLTNEEKDVV